MCTREPADRGVERACHARLVEYVAWGRMPEHMREASGSAEPGGVQVLAVLPTFEQEFPLTHWPPPRQQFV